MNAEKTGAGRGEGGEERGARQQWAGWTQCNTTGASTHRIGDEDTGSVVQAAHSGSTRQREAGMLRVPNVRRTRHNGKPGKLMNKHEFTQNQRNGRPTHSVVSPGLKLCAVSVAMYVPFGDSSYTYTSLGPVYTGKGSNRERNECG